MKKYTVERGNIVRDRIAVKESNRERIDNMLNAVQTRCSVRLADYDDIVNAIEVIEWRLRIPKNAMFGIVARVDPNAETFCNAYQKAAIRPPQSTHFTIERTNSGWVLTEAARAICMGSTMGYKLNLTEKAKDAIIKAREVF